MDNVIDTTYMQFYDSLMREYNEKGGQGAGAGGKFISNEYSGAAQKYLSRDDNKKVAARKIDPVLAKKCIA